MTNFTITVDRKNGKLLLIANESYKKFIVRNEQAAEVIKEIAEQAKISKISESGDTLVIKCKEFNVVIDSSDERIFQYKGELYPLAQRVTEFEQKNNRHELSNRVKRQNELSRKKVVGREYNPRSNEYRNEVRRIPHDKLEGIISKKALEKVIKGAATVVGLAILAYGAVSIIHANNEKKGSSSLDKETSAYTVVAEQTQAPAYFVVDEQGNTNIDSTSYEEDNTYEEPIVDEGQHIEMDCSKVRMYAEKADKCEALYGDMINETAEKYGIPAEMLLSIATQESGVHEIDPKRDAKGLFQIRASIYVGYEIRSFNYITNEWEKHKITMDDLNDVRGNIDIAGRIFQENYLNYSQQNPLAAPLCHNYGPGGLNQVANTYIDNCKERNPELNLTPKGVFSNMNDFGWLNYVGSLDDRFDLYYFQRLLAYCQHFKGDNFELAYRNPDGTVNIAKFRTLQMNAGTMSFDVSCLTDIYNEVQNHNR